jgi:collagen type III alpha
VDAIVRRIMNSDKDGDGKLSKDEAPERLREHFNQIDADDDGQIDRSELKKAMSRFGRRRGGEHSGPPRGRPNRPARSEEV